MSIVSPLLRSTLLLAPLVPVPSPSSVRFSRLDRRSASDLKFSHNTWRGPRYIQQDRLNHFRCLINLTRSAPHSPSHRARSVLGPPHATSQPVDVVYRGLGLATTIKRQETYHWDGSVRLCIPSLFLEIPPRPFLPIPRPLQSPLSACPRPLPPPSAQQQSTPASTIHSLRGCVDFSVSHVCSSPFPFPFPFLRSRPALFHGCLDCSTGMG
jgi:hypothetical protein